MAKCEACKHDVPDDAAFCGACGRTMPARHNTVPGEPLGVPPRVEHTVDEPGDGSGTELTDDSATLPVGSIVDRKYAIVRVLGQGGMGVVYLARDVHTDLEVVIKAVRRELAHRPDLRARMLAEGRALAQIDHPNVVRLNSVVAQAEDLWLVMQYIDGETLDKIIASHKPHGMPMGKAVGIFRQIVAGVGAANKEGVIHRDLKPANVIVRKKDGVAKVMDFGIAKLPNKPDGAITKGVIGSLWYMSPEQVKGRRDLDERVDVYALGILLYQMVVGKVPFNGPSEYDIMKLQAEAPMPYARAVRSDLPMELDQIIQKATQKERDARFANCEELLDAIEDHAAILGLTFQKNSGVLRLSADASGGFPRVAAQLHPPVPPPPTAPDADAKPVPKTTPQEELEKPAASIPPEERASHPGGITAEDEVAPVETGEVALEEPKSDPAAPAEVDAAPADAAPAEAAPASPVEGLATDAPPEKQEEPPAASPPAMEARPPVAEPKRSRAWIAILVAILVLGGAGAGAVAAGLAPNPFEAPPPPKRKPKPPPTFVAPPPPAPTPTVTAAPKPKSPLEPLVGSWVGNKRELEAVLDGDVLEFRVKTPAQFAPQDYEAGEARFAIRATSEPNVFTVEDRIRPIPPEGKTYDPRSRATCQDALTQVAGEPLRARLDGTKLSVDFAQIQPAEANFVVEPATNKITSCVGLSDLKATKSVKAELTRAPEHRP